MKKIFLFFVFFGALTSYSPEISTKSKIERDKESFKTLLVKRFSKEYADSILGDPRFGIDSFLVRLSKHKRKADYSFLFTDSSVARGKSFLRSYKPVRSASDSFGVPASVITAIFRVESDFGLFLGRHNAPNAYFTLFHLSRTQQRKSYLMGEFSKIISLAKEMKRDPFSIPVSRAGAMGLPQFMPSSFPLAIDGDKDGVSDILFSYTDAVWSIAHYLKKTGWNPRDKVSSLKRYNNSTLYAKSVLKYADIISKK